MSKLIVLFVVLAVFAAVSEAKGSFGYKRSSSGGYFRSAKGGYYSQRTRYYTSGMYWSSGYRYSSRASGYNGPAIRTSGGAPSESEMQDVLCKRQVVVDTEKANYGTSMTFNSTQRCIKELYAIPGDPGNKDVENLMLDRMVFNLDIKTYPTVAMTVYPDKDVVVPILNLTMRLRRLFFTTSRTSQISAGIPDIDLAQVAWKPCSLASCDSTASRSFGQPSSRFVDAGRVVTSAVTGSINGMRILLRFWIPNDFDEDGSYNHVFLLPSLVKVDVAIVVENAFQFNLFTGNRTGYAGVEAILVNPATGPSSSIAPIKVKDTHRPIEYNPRQMDRVQIGSFVDQKDKKGGLLSWWTATNDRHLCLNSSSPTCVNFLDWSNATVSTACSQGATSPSYCEDILYPGFVGRSLRWVFANPLDENLDVYWYMNFGYWDPFQGSEPTPNGALSTSASVLALVVLLIASLL